MADDDSKHGSQRVEKVDKYLLTFTSDITGFPELIRGDMIYGNRSVKSTDDLIDVQFTSSCYN